MIITPATLEGLTLGGSAAGRSPGLHMSDIYNDYFQLSEPKRYDKSKPMDMVRVEAGLVFEEMLEDGLQARFGLMLGGERPGEFTTVEGIHYTPDLILFDGRGTVLGEIKLTWLSARECPISPCMEKRTGIPSNWDGHSDVAFPRKFDKYFVQMMSYCYHLRTSHARLLVYFVNGNYRPPAPALLSWDFTFSKIELVENWRMMMNHARTRKLIVC